MADAAAQGLAATVLTAVGSSLAQQRRDANAATRSGGCDSCPFKQQAAEITAAAQITAAAPALDAAAAIDAAVEATLAPAHAALRMLLQYCDWGESPPKAPGRPPTCSSPLQGGSRTARQTAAAGRLPVLRLLVAQQPRQRQLQKQQRQRNQRKLPGPINLPACCHMRQRECSPLRSGLARRSAGQQRGQWRCPAPVLCVEMLLDSVF